MALGTCFHTFQCILVAVSLGVRWHLVFFKLSAYVADCNNVTPLQQSTRAPFYTHQVTLTLISDIEASSVGNEIRRAIDPRDSQLK